MAHAPTTSVALVGCGTIAEAYAATMADEPTLALVAAADLVPARAEALTAAHGGTAYPSLEAMLAASDAEVVVNLTIHDAHAAVTRQALAAGRHVFSEKPLALDPAEARALVALADRQGLVLGCAPMSAAGDAQRLAGRLLAEGRCGAVRMVYATCNLGRLTEWNANPEPFLRVGPLFDGAVYPLTVLTALFGPVVRVEAAHQALLLAEHAHDGRRFAVETPDHTVAVLRFGAGPHGAAVRAQLTASMYVPYQTRHFNSIEIHGDDGSVWLQNAGDTGAADRAAVQFARLGAGYRPVPLPRAPRPLTYASAVADFAAAARAGRPPTASGAQAAHLVAVIDAIERCAETRAPVEVEEGPWQPERSGQTPSPSALSTSNAAVPEAAVPEAAVRDAPTLPPVGFGCSRYRGGDTYVDLEDAITAALDMGVRLLDTAELYGTDAAIGRILRRPGSPARDALTVVGKIWNTNHTPDHVGPACDDALARLGLDAFDALLLHWPHAWPHTGPLGDLSVATPAAIQAKAFPTDDAGEIQTADVPLAATWRAMERLVADGQARALGVSNFERADLEPLLAEVEIPPAINQIRHHPYENRADLIAFCRAHGMQVMAHSPLSADGLLADPAIRDIAEAHGVLPAQVVLRWIVQQGVAPIPSSTNPAHIAANLDLFGFALTPAEMARLDALDGGEA